MGWEGCRGLSQVWVHSLGRMEGKVEGGSDSASAVSHTLVLL